jgi:hypothetical protein
MHPKRIAQWLVSLGLALALPLTSPWVGAAAPTASAASFLGATITVLAAPVEVGDTISGGFTAAIDGQSLLKGDVVRTGPGGSVLLTFFDGSESQLGSESQVQIE